MFPRMPVPPGIKPILAAGGFLLLAAGSSPAALRALIVVGQPGSQADADMLAQLTQATKAGVVARGGTVEIVGPDPNGPPARERILSALGAETKLADSDEFWLFLFGHCAKGRDGQPAFQIKGPRLGAEDLRAALEKIPAARFVFVGAEGSGGYLDVLRLPKCDVLAATDAHGEVSFPRFPEHWVEAFTHAPQADLRTVSARAAEALEKDIVNKGLARSEHARLRDAATGQVLGPPFGADSARLARDVAAAAGPGARVRPEDIEIPQATGNSLFERVEASDETRAILAEARAVPNPSGHPAVILQADTQVTLDKAGGVEETRTLRVFVPGEDALDRWANWAFRQDPPVYETQVTAGRIILPDAASYIVNPAKLQAESSGGFCGLLFPHAEAGCVIELAVKETNRPGYQLPMFYREFPLQDDVPTVSRSITLRLPKGRDYGTFLQNSRSEPVRSETEHSQVLRWTLRDLPPFERLPDAPPDREMAMWLGVSSAKSWEEFSEWYRHISEGAFAAGPAVKAKAAEIAARHSARQDRIREAFQFVSALRYAAIEFGIGGIRPRTPEKVLENRYGDCKDKANLLIALLGEMGIPARFALINRLDTTVKDFPGWQFNHAIAMVPPGEGQKETLWLDSTDTVTPFGFVAPGNLGREALVFDRNRADFQKVTLAGNAPSRQHETWTLREMEPGRWTGSVTLQPSGLREYETRLQLKPLSPLKRGLWLQQTFSDRLPGGDFSVGKLSNPSDLAEPLLLKGTWEMAGGGAPGPGGEWQHKVVAPTRDRDLLLNDGQPLVLEQRVTAELAGPVPPLPEPFVIEAAGQKFSITYQKTGDHTFERSALCDIRQPRIPPADYPAFRDALRQWSARLQTFSP